MKDTLDFIVIGAQKAGTTSLFEHLRRHPQISLPVNKEVPYFSHDNQVLRGWDSYMERVALVAGEHLWGTVTPHYMVGGVYRRARVLAEAAGGYDERTVPLRIRERLPDVRLVAILRDPVARARSHHQMMVLNGSEQRSFDDAIAELLLPASLEDARRRPGESMGYVTFGEYGRILAGYFSIFPPEQMLVVFTDELERSPAQLMTRVYDFLGVRSDFIPDSIGVKYRPAGSERRISWIAHPARVRRVLKRRPVARAAWRLLPKSSQIRIENNFRGFVFRTELWNRRSGSDTRQPSRETLDRLREHFTEDTDQLATLLGVSPPWQSPGQGHGLA